MKFSIIMPAYNEENKISNAIKSILNQTYKNFELIIINDGSTDNTLKIINQYKGKNIKVINQKNLGVSAARNAGIKESQGNYILFIDADDYIDNDLLINLVKTIKNNKNHWIYFKMIKEFKNKKKYSDIYENYQNKSLKINDCISELIISELINSPWGKVYKREIIAKNEILFNDSLLIAEDLLFNLDYAKNVDCIYFSDIGYYHYDGNVENSITASLDYDKYNSLMKFHEIIDKEEYNTYFNIKPELNFIKFKNDYAYLRSLDSQNSSDEFKSQLNYMNQEQYDYLPNIIWKFVYIIIRSKSTFLNKKLISIIQNIQK